MKQFKLTIKALSPLLNSFRIDYPKRMFSSLFHDSVLSTLLSKYILKNNKITKGGTNPRTAFKHLMFPYKDRIWYRVFAKWVCSNKKCNNKWESAYSWILLDAYIANTFPSKLISGSDFLRQECRKCKNLHNEWSWYEHLISSGNGDKTPHKTELCYKCKKGYPCNKAS